MNDSNVNPYNLQPHIVHEKRTDHHANMHRLVVDGTAGKWVRAWDEFAVSEGYAASPWSVKSLPAIFKYDSVWATVVEPKKITEYYTDSELGLDGWKRGKS